MGAGVKLRGEPGEKRICGDCSQEKAAVSEISRALHLCPNTGLWRCFLLRGV